MMRSPGFLLLILLCAGIASAAEPPRVESLRVAWGLHNAPPYAIVEREQLTGGVIREIGDAIAEHIGTTATYVQVPRARYEAQMRGGTIDMTCITNPQWLQQPDALAWSPPLFEEADIFVQGPGRSAWKSLKDITNKRIGTIHAYHYPSLDHLFASQQAIRDDGSNLDGNMRRLVLGRLDAVIDAEIPVRWWLISNNMRQRLTFADFEVSRHPVHCAISPLTRAGHDVVRAAFVDLLKDGSLQRRLARYVDIP